MVAASTDDCQDVRAGGRGYWQCGAENAIFKVEALFWLGWAVRSSSGSSCPRARGEIRRPENRLTSRFWAFRRGSHTLQDLLSCGEGDRPLSPVRGGLHHMIGAADVLANGGGEP
jgi:hypothetical protein